MKLNVKKTMLTFLLTSTLVLNKSGVLAKDVHYVESNYFKSSIDNIMRVNNNHFSPVIGCVNKDDVVYRLLSCDNGWYLVKYNDMIGYVYADYLEDMHIVEEDVNHIPINDIVVTDSKVNFRLGPSLDAKRITSINKEQLLDVIAKTDNNWYLVNYNGKLGYVSGKYVNSVVDMINDVYPNLRINSLNFSKIVYVNSSSLNIRSGPSKDYDKIGIFWRRDSLRVLKEFGDWYFVINNDNVFGFIDKNFTSELNGQYVIIDLSNQKLWLYNDGELSLSTSVVTGKNDTPTNVGLFKIYAKQTDRYLIGEDYYSYVNYWLPFNGGIGMHDATWRKKFGGTIYEKDGSHGCVNMPLDVTDDIYNNVSVGTKVLVHK